MASISSKIYSREKLVKVIKKLKKEGKKIGITNGAFDLLHAGHVRYLEDAKKLCDILIVSVNTDISVRLYKDSNRPINSESDRTMIVAALASVDYVTFHSERHMKAVLLALKPDLYIKGGDYNPDLLTSKDVLDQWKGKVALVSLVPGKSTTKIIEKIIHRYVDKTISVDIEIPKNLQKAIILDRDGVINKDIDYLHVPEKLQLLPGVIKGIQKIQKIGFHIVIITNQPGIGLGYYSEEDFYRVNKKMLQTMHENNILVSKIYFCPHSKSENCNCRKPKTGLLERAKTDLNLDIEHTWMIGDKSSDILAGKRMGFSTILINSGQGEDYKPFGITTDFTAKNLLEAAKIIQEHT